MFESNRYNKLYSSESMSKMAEENLEPAHTPAAKKGSGTFKWEGRG
jgi:hypothetical protein